MFHFGLQKREAYGEMLGHVRLSPDALERPKIASMLSKHGITAARSCAGLLRLRAKRRTA
jgi:hypothetical protein